MVAIFTLLASLCALAAAKPAFRDFVVHDARQAAPQGFLRVGTAPANQTFNLRVGLASNNIAGLEKALFDVSTPGSALYGQHLTIEEVNAFVAPTAETLNAVNAWLSSHGLSATSASPAGDWLSVPVTVAQANKLLNANYEVFTHISSGKQISRSLSVSIPANLQPHIDAFHPTTSFNKPVSSGPLFRVASSSPEKRAVPTSCANTITPACLQALYGIPATPAKESSNQLGVSGFIDQFAQTADLKSFLTKTRPDISSSTTFKLQTLDGGSNPQGRGDAGIEANLDTQYTIGVATNVPNVFISVGNNFQDGDLGGFLDIINFLLKENPRPQVLTTSYGENESDLSSALEIKLCNAYMQIGAVGTSILFASGDGGVSGGQSQSCTTFQPAFPAGCPFLTGVGATTGISPETAATFSSGGFSNVWGIPGYQASAVSTYLTALGNTNAGKFNRSGRAFPDVSAQGENVEIVSGGQTGTVAGTSCSSPIFASVIALINDQLIAAGKPVLGFLNPFLYANPSAFTDITTGDNPGCNTNGFPAKTGWDPVTGLGTPIFSKLLAAAGV